MENHPRSWCFFYLPSTREVFLALGTGMDRVLTDSVGWGCHRSPTRRPQARESCRGWSTDGVRATAIAAALKLPARRSGLRSCMCKLKLLYRRVFVEYSFAFICAQKKSIRFLMLRFLHHSPMSRASEVTSPLGPDRRGNGRPGLRSKPPGLTPTPTLTPNI